MNENSPQLRLYGEKSAWILIGAINKALLEIRGHSFDYYTSADRRREVADVKHQIRHIFHRISDVTLTRSGQMFCCNHATFIHSLQMADELLEYNADFAESYNILYTRIIQILEQ